MNLETAVMEQLKTAMKNKDEAALRGLRAIKAAIIVAKTSTGAGGALKEEEEIKLLQKLVKQRKDSLDIFTKQNRPELAQKEAEEIGIIEQFLPKQLTAEELHPLIAKMIAETGIREPGKIMGMANKELTGRADGKTIAAVVKEILN
jgi:uncharacterized protein YqeY